METFYCRLLKDKNMTGICISEHVHPIPREMQNEKGETITTIVMEALLSILWENQRSPAPCYHNPSEIEWIEVPKMTLVEAEIASYEDAEEDEEDEETDEEIEASEEEEETEALNV